MIKFDTFIKFQQLFEASYVGNIGFEELVRFYRKASSAQEKEMEDILNNNDFDAFKKLIKKVLGVTLK